MTSSRRLRRGWDVAWIVLALAVVAWIFYRNTMVASRVIDGHRWFFLDDDQMISMRYARNLAEGHGLVWNVGEHVEGYTNFLWTMVMALVHLAGAPDRTASVWVRLFSFGFFAGALVQGIRLVRIFAPRSLAVTPVFLTVTVAAIDVTLWAAWGYETALVTFLLLSFLVSVLAGSTRPWGWIALALIPLTRADGVYLFVAGAAIAVGLADDRRACARRLALAALPLVAYVVFRVAYYGDWLPNTYYLKVYRLDGVFRRGASYAWNFFLRYPIPIVVATWSAVAIARRDRRGLTFFVVLFAAFFYVVMSTGGDALHSFRFFAPVLPVIFAFATVGIVHAVTYRVGRVLWIALLLLASVPFARPIDRLIGLDTNGDPQEQIQVAMLVKKNALPESSIAVLAAGIVPYFTRLRSIDVLGKSDKHVARLKPFPGAPVGHGKLDPGYTLNERRPDLVVSYRSAAFAAGLTPGTRTTDPVLSFIASHPFQSSYRGFPIQNDFLLETTAVYTHEGSPEATRRAWKPISVGHWP